MNLKTLLARTVSIILTLAPLSTVSPAQTSAPSRTVASPVSKVWVADNGDGTYKNPIIHADYSDPDAVRVGDDFYMTASSFNAAPGLPILHSRDLVNWRLIGHVFTRQHPLDVFSKPQHGGGVWAPSIRHHKGEFYIYYPDPDFGIYLTKAKDPAGPWSEPVLVKEAKGWIDPCPLWDADGNAYLVSALAASRSGVKSILVVSRMSADGTRLLDDGIMVFDGHDKHPTLEGPKFYKRNGYYYIFAPAGGVEQGWQLVLRSKHVYGPYEAKVVLAQGKSPVNGPHQGAWIETQAGESWFIHFQDKGAYGRIVHLQPVKWVNDWPVIGVDADGDGTGEPVLTHRKPNVGATSWPVVTPPDSDEFDAAGLGLQWQWHANPSTHWAFPAPPLGFLRLFNVPLPDAHKNFWDVPNLLLQKFPAEQFTATTRVTFTPRTDDEETGLVVMGLDYAYVSVKKKPAGLFVSQTVVKDAEGGGKGQEGAQTLLKGNTFYLRVKVSKEAACQFSYSTDGSNFIPLGAPFAARKGKWIGAKIGLFAIRTGRTRETGYADIDWFRIE
ncbi:MAG: glycoside hydrolase 43 family protein [Acidobacteria bacterium]|nr:glycoside hydrolase 43 family protein [Acidobacteriota bacterium]